MILIAAIVLTLAVFPFLWEALRRPVNATVRQDAPGAFANLSGGLTHYQWHGPETGPVVVCVHGLSTPSFVWRSIADALADNGFRVLTYDLYGRGYSDRPQGVQDTAFFNKQLSELLADQNITGNIALVGYSMGGAIVTAFAAKTPHSITRLVLLTPAGMQAVGEGQLQRMAHLPLLSRWLMLGIYPFMLSKGLRREENQPSSVPGINDLQRAEMKFKGFFPAIHQSVTGMLTDPFKRFHTDLRDRSLPILAIWGEADTVVPLSAKDRLQQWNPQVVHHVVKGAGHGVTYSHTPEVLDRMIPFLKGQD